MCSTRVRSRQDLASLQAERVLRKLVWLWKSSFLRRGVICAPDRANSTSRAPSFSSAERVGSAQMNLSGAFAAFVQSRPSAAAG